MSQGCRTSSCSQTSFAVQRVTRKLLTFPHWLNRIINMWLIREDRTYRCWSASAKLQSHRVRGFSLSPTSSLENWVGYKILSNTESVPNSNGHCFTTGLQVVFGFSEHQDQRLHLVLQDETLSWLYQTGCYLSPNLF